MSTDDKIRAIDVLTRIISIVKDDEVTKIAMKKLIVLINSLEVL